MHEVQVPTPGCRWYHAQTLPGLGRVGKVDGHMWDFRAPGRADAYLGGVDFQGKRVLEVGPASGFWTVEMCRRGASVLALEIDAEHEWDVVPGMQPDDPDRAAGMEMVKAGWHLAVQQWRTVADIRAEIVYGHAEHPPTDRGRFDVLMLGAVLLHTRRPFDILERCAALTDETVVIVERHFPELGIEPVMRFAPSTPADWGTWWDFSPAWFERVLPLLGFADVTVSYHEQTYTPWLLPMFTVVARRRAHESVTPIQPPS